MKQLGVLAGHLGVGVVGECPSILMPLSIQWYRKNSNTIWQGSRYSLRSENRIQPRDLTCGVGFLGTGLSQATQLNYGLNSSSLGGLGCSHSESKSHLSIGMIPALRSLSRDHVGLTTTVAWLRLCDSCRQVATDYSKEDCTEDESVFHPPHPRAAT